MSIPLPYKQINKIKMNRVQPDTEIPKEQAIIEYVANISQTGTGSPIATILKTTGRIQVIWTRTNTGIYQGEVIINDETPDIDLETCATITCQQTQPGKETTANGHNNYIDLYTYDGAAYQDDGLIKAAFTLKIYTNKT